MSLPYDNKNLSLARSMRKQDTRQERHLWFDFLRSYPVRFQRQKLIDGYIVDFYCYKARLVVELDGSQHYTAHGIEYDENRTNDLQLHGLEILRFTNIDIDERFDAVCERIDAVVKARLHGG